MTVAPGTIPEDTNMSRPHAVSVCATLALCLAGCAPEQPAATSAAMPVQSAKIAEVAPAPRPRPEKHYLGWPTSHWLALLRDKDTDVAQYAFRALSALDDEAAVPELVAMIADEDHAVRWHARRLLQGMGTKAAAALPALEARWDALPPGKERGELAYAVLYLRGEWPRDNDPYRATRLLTIVRTYPDPIVRLYALRDLDEGYGSSGPRSPERVQAVAAALQDPDPEVRKVARRFATLRPLPGRPRGG
jgi:hypothetical protein